MRIYEYKLVKSTFISGPKSFLDTAIERLEQDVQQQLAAGWRCQGGAVIDHTSGVAYQTMSRSTIVKPQP